MVTWAVLITNWANLIKPRYIIKRLRRSPVKSAIGEGKGFNWVARVEFSTIRETGPGGLKMSLMVGSLPITRRPLTITTQPMLCLPMFMIDIGKGPSLAAWVNSTTPWDALDGRVENVSRLIRNLKQLKRLILGGVKVQI